MLMQYANVNRKTQMKAQARQELLGAEMNTRMRTSQVVSDRGLHGLNYLCPMCLRSVLRERVSDGKAFCSKDCCKLACQKKYGSRATSAIESEICRGAYQRLHARQKDLDRGKLPVYTPRILEALRRASEIRAEESQESKGSVPPRMSEMVESIAESLERKCAMKPDATPVPPLTHNRA